MMPFDPYLNWLGIPQHEQPPNFYRLLGVVLFESNQHVIEQAADRQSLLVGAYQTGPYAELCQQLLSEIAMARFNLLDPQQKASYDTYLQESLAHRGERAVSAPPPPAMFAAPQQFGSPSQFGPAPGAPANGEKRLAGPPPPAQSPRPMPQQTPFPAMPQPMTAQSPMPTRQQPTMPQPTMRSPAVMPTPSSFGPPMPAPAPIPVAAPFPTATRANSSGNGATATMAPPVSPPAAPQRPMDEIENLSSQPTTRRRFAKKKKKDVGKEIIIGGIAAAFAVLLLIAFVIMNSQNSGPRGFDAIDPATSNSEMATKALTSAKKTADKIKEKDRVAADHGSQESPLRKMDQPKQRKKKSPSADEGDFIIKAPTTSSETSRLRPIDAPDKNVASPAPVPVQVPQDTPQNLGGDGDPVMELPPPDKEAPKPDP